MIPAWPAIRPGLRALVSTALVLVAAGCATAPAPDPGTGTIWGYVRLVPRAGSASSGAGYGDRRLATVKRFDYAHPRFAVVVASTTAPDPDAPALLRVQDTKQGPRLEPTHAATSPDAGLRITNETTRPRILSLPSAGRLIRVEPRESVDLPALAPGEQLVHLLGEAPNEDTHALVWVAAGARAEIAPSGRYVLRGLPPGRHALEAWHPRLPPSPERVVDVGPGRVERVDIEIGVDLAHAEESSR
ncbi:MAG: carboxypeptidase-like regulatory domain-containing protein [Myxococcota bacterium]